jgi:hypothetical protein
MADKNNNRSLVFLFLLITVVFIIPFVSSCGKGGAASSVGLNTQLEILNLSPNLQPVTLYIGYIKQSTSTYTYPYGSGYFYLNSIDTPLQIRSAYYTNVNYITHDYNFKANHKYSLFIIGLLPDTITPIFTLDDTVTNPITGFGKVRFVNASMQNTNLDVSANDTVAFPGVTYKTVTNYVQMAAGNYTFKVNQTGTPGTIIGSIPSTPIQDGHLYTIYSYGIVGKTDTSQFAIQILTNR